MAGNVRNRRLAKERQRGIQLPKKKRQREKALQQRWYRFVDRETLTPEVSKQ